MQIRSPVGVEVPLIFVDLQHSEVHFRTPVTQIADLAVYRVRPILVSVELLLVLAERGDLVYDGKRRCEGDGYG